MTTQRIFALTTRGLEEISAAEISALPGVSVTEVAYRRVAATVAQSALRSLLDLRTVDDLFLEVATWPDIGRPREALARLRDSSAHLDLRAAADRCSAVRAISEQAANALSIDAAPMFSITPSFVGKRNYNTEEIRDAIAAGIETGHGWHFSALDDEADFNLRVFIEHETAFVGVRLARRPLQERAYKQSHLAGSLKPPIAAAMLHLADVRAGVNLLDPCCGAGTILIEAALCGVVAQGGDQSSAAIQATLDNARAAGVCVAAQQWDAAALPLADASIERIVCNLPWGRQVPTDAALAGFYRDACLEMRRVLAPDGRIALLTSAPEMLHFPTLRCQWQIEISVFGQNPTITLYASPD
jgi:tRNA (guanine6-N2)-methyltransferase